MAAMAVAWRQSMVMALENGEKKKKKKKKKSGAKIG